MKRPRSQEPASTSVDLLALRECVEQFNTKTIVLLGDFVADEFQYGEISRVSREAPVLILKHRETQLVPAAAPTPPTTSRLSAPESCPLQRSAMMPRERR